MSSAAAARQPAVDATALARRFGTNWVLRGVTFRVGPGEVVGLMGANGSGKSTILRILATLLRPHAGRAQVCGCDTRSAADHVRSLVGYLGHSPGLYDDLSARENLAFAARMLARPAGDVEVALERVGLTAAAGRQVRGLSAGMQRRLALARLTLARPRVLLLDEPYSNLDADGIALINEMIGEWREDGVAAIMVLHEQAPAAALLDRTIAIQDGRIDAPQHPTVDVRPLRSVARR